MKKKITFYCDSMDKGGTEKATLDLVNSLPSEKYEITIVQLTPGGRYQKELNNNIKVKEILPVGPEKSFKWYWRFRRIYHLLPARLNHFLFIGNKQDVEVACGYGYPNVIVSKSKKAKKILWVHMDVAIDRNKVSDMTREEGEKYFSNIDNIICVSRDCEKSFIEKFGFEDKTLVKYNVLKTDEIKAKAAEKVINLGSDSLNMVSIGRLTWQKGYDRLIEALSIVNDKRIQLYIIGQGEDAKQLKKQVKDKGLEDNVHFLGYCHNPYCYLKSADIYICSSRFEGLSLAMEESLIVGTPVLTTRCTGVEELIGDKPYGIVVDNNTEGLVEGITRILNDSEVIQRMKEFNRINKNPIINYKRTVELWADLLDNN